MLWMFHDAVVEDLDGFVAAAKEFGDDMIILSGPKPLFPITKGDQPVFAFVPIQVARQMVDFGLTSMRPGVYWSNSGYDMNEWMPFVHEYLLNYDALWIPWGTLKSRGIGWMIDQFNDPTRVFIRPNSGNKVFAGQSFMLEDFDRFVMGMDATTGINSNTMVAVSRHKKIDFDVEWRFWVVDGKVVASSPYSWYDLSMDPPEEVMALADLIAARTISMEWNVPEDGVVLDLCLSEGIPRLVEMNSLSCSGTYRVDPMKLLSGLRPALERYPNPRP